MTIWSLKVLMKIAVCVCMCVFVYVCGAYVCGVHVCVCVCVCGVCTSTEHFVLSSYLGMNINQFGLLEGAN